MLVCPTLYLVLYSILTQLLLTHLVGILGAQDRAHVGLRSSKPTS